VQSEEIDVSLDELENRLDRLRSLYEQYFLGIEKIEPGVARKDVDRRFWLLRRVQIRNTARRFRLQVLIQRYNTFQQYWARICREIENGTYTRHLLRAQKRLGEEPKTWAAKKRLGYFRKQADGSVESDDAVGSSDNGGSDLAALLDARIDLAEEAARAAEAAVEAADARARSTAVASPSVAQVPSRPAAPLAPAGARKPEPRSRFDLGTLDLDLDDELGAPPTPVRAEPRPVARQPSPPVGPLPAQVQPERARPVAAAARPEPRPSPPATPIGTAVRQSPAQAQGSARVDGPVAPPPVPRRDPAPLAANPAAKVDANPGAPRLPLPRPAAPANPTRSATAAEVAGLSDARLRQIHSELADAKRRLNQSDSVSLDSLARSLRESEKKIRAQHPGRTVDFHVVLKDGKPVVKPIVRK